MMKFLWSHALVAFSLLVCSTHVAVSADWPTWRCDQQRTAKSPADLPDQLHPQWTRQLPPTLPAWPNESRLHFDTAYEPIVCGHLLLIGSPQDGSVTAYHTTDGAQLWKFYAEGPVRFAPTSDGQRIYFGSDDGYVYCVSISAGQLLWKYRVAPADRGERKHLGNGRLISYWPVRGGAVLQEGVLYVAAGVWPTMGVYVVALDAASGRPVWRNDEIARLEKVRIDHDVLSTSALSPQGYLALAGDMLIVPNGRSLPACLDRSTGKLRHYVQGYRNGDCHVTVQSPYAFVGESGVVDLRVGREVGGSWGTPAERKPDDADVGGIHLSESPMIPYKLFAGCSWRSVLADRKAFDFCEGAFAAYDLTDVTVSQYSSQSLGASKTTPRWDPKKLWSLATDVKVKTNADAIVIGAGRRLYGHADGALLALDLPSGNQPARLAWRQPLTGQPAVLVAADDRLFAVTAEGTLTCFGAEQREVAHHSLVEKPLRSPDPHWAKQAAEIVSRTQVRQGYCVVLGIGTGKLIEALLAADTQVKVIAVDADAAKVRKCREELFAAGVYPTRAEAFVGLPADFIMPHYGVVALTTEDPAAVDQILSLPAADFYERLRPYGGAIALALPGGRHDSFAKWAKDLKTEAPRVERVGELSWLRRTGALEDSASWTHECADAARSFFSQDRRTRPPFAVLWYGEGDDFGFWKRKDYNTGIKPQAAGGRVFAINGPSLSAYDAFTGRHQWATSIARNPRYVSLADGIYVAAGNQCHVYDPTDGTQKAEFTFQSRDGASDSMSELRVSDKIILAGVVAAERRPKVQGLYHSDVLIALDRHTGKQLWTRAARDRYSNNSLAIGGGAVWCVDSPTLESVSEAVRRGKPDALPPSTLLSLDELTGEPRWTKDIAYELSPKQSTLLNNRNHDDWLGYSEAESLVVTGRIDQAFAFKSTGGEAVWKQTVRGQPMMIERKTYRSQYGQAYDLFTGEPKGPLPKLTRGGCNYRVANEFCIFARAHSASYFDISQNQEQELYATRTGCSNSTIAADGLLNVPNFAVGCVCNYPIQTCFALFHLDEAGEWLATTPPAPAR